MRILSGLRRRAWQEPDAAWLSAIPGRLVDEWRLRAPEPPERRIEIGSGWSPRPGYVHVDVVPFHDDIDLVTSGSRLPFPEAWASEILSVHMIEHVPPPAIRETLEHWHGVLAPGGRLVIHTPNATALGRAFVEGEPGAFWPAISAVFGYGLPPDAAVSPNALRAEPDHRLLFTFHTISEALLDAGFVDVQDVSGQDPACHHTTDWADVVPGLCLEVEAVKP